MSSFTHTQLFIQHSQSLPLGIQNSKLSSSLMKGEAWMKGFSDLWSRKRLDVLILEYEYCIYFLIINSVLGIHATLRALSEHIYSMAIEKFFSMIL